MVSTDSTNLKKNSVVTIILSELSVSCTYKRIIFVFYLDNLYYILTDGTEYSDGISNVEPADKLSIRRYIRGVCNAPRCVDTFFLYLSSPTRRDGSALLWDSNGNGIVSITYTKTIRLTIVYIGTYVIL